MGVKTREHSFFFLTTTQEVTMNIDTETASPARHGRWLALVAVALFAVACMRFASSHCSRSYDADE